VFEVSYTIHDASRATGVPVSTLQFFIKNGELPTVKLGRVRVIR
jgi:excisionase family DNA binding protein